MNRPWMGLCLGLLFLCPASDGLGAAAPPATLVPESRGVVVEQVEEGFAPTRRVSSPATSCSVGSVPPRHPPIRSQRATTWIHPSTSTRWKWSKRRAGSSRCRG